MTITYTWKVTSIKVKNVSESKQNAVVQTYWQKIGTDETGNQGTFSGATPFTVDPTDASGPFIAFEDLTEADVLSWIQSVVIGGYEEHVNQQIQKQIEEKINVVTEATMPWMSVVNPDMPAAPLNMDEANTASTVE